MFCLLSFPIPEENDKNSIDTGRTYADLQFDDGASYIDILKQQYFVKNKGVFAKLY